MGYKRGCVGMLLAIEKRFERPCMLVLLHCVVNKLCKRELWGSSIPPK